MKRLGQRLQLGTLLFLVACGNSGSSAPPPPGNSQPTTPPTTGTPPATPTAQPRARDAGSAPRTAPAVPRVVQPIPAGDAGPSPLKIVKTSFARAIENRSPVGAEQPFTTNDAKVYQYFEVINSGEVPDELVISFYRPNGRMLGAPLRLDVPPVKRPYRTWAFARVNRAAGLWTAVVTDHNNTELMRSNFEVIAAPPPVAGADAQAP